MEVGSFWSGFSVTSELQISTFLSALLMNVPFIISQILEDEMTMVMLISPKLLTVSEKLSHNLFSLKGDSVLSPILDDDNKSVTGEEIYNLLPIYGEPILTEDLVGPKLWGMYNPSYIPRVIGEKTVSHETAFHTNN